MYFKFEFVFSNAWLLVSCLVSFCIFCIGQLDLCMWLKKGNLWLHLGNYFCGWKANHENFSIFNFLENTSFVKATLAFAVKMCLIYIVWSKMKFNFFSNLWWWYIILKCKIGIKVFNSKEVGEVQEGADCYSARKLSKHSKGWLKC